MPKLSPSELAHRRNGLGSTDVVEALGLAPWEGAGPMRVYLAKTGDAPDDEPANADHLEWGHQMEPLILAWYERQMGVRTIPGGHVPHRDHDWLWATLDATVIDGSQNVEIKNVGANMGHHWDTYAEDGVPRYVRAQCMVGMACSGKLLTDVVASVGGRPPHVWTVAWDAELWGLMLEGAERFWRNVQAGIAPPLDHTPASKEYLRRKYPSKADRLIVTASPEIEMLARRRMTLSALEKTSARDKDRIDALLLEGVGLSGADGLQGDGWKLTWNVSAKTGKRVQRFTDQGED